MNREDWVGAPNPRTLPHLKRLEKAVAEDDVAIEACWTCAFPLHPIDMIDSFRFVNNRVYCSKCVPRGVRSKQAQKT